MQQINNNYFFKRVLIVDDSETDIFVASFGMNRNLFAQEIVAHQSALDGLQYLRSLEGTPELLPQLIFLDIRMPGMDGFGFLDEYAKMPDSIKETCIIVMLSSSIDNEEHLRAEENPYVNRFITKPLNKENMEVLKQDFVKMKAA